MRSSVVSGDRALLEGLDPMIRNKVRVYTADYLSSIKDI